MIKFLKINEIAVLLNESPEIIRKECELHEIPHNRMPDGEYLFTAEDVLAVRKPREKAEPEVKIPQDEAPRPTAAKKKIPVAKKAR